MSLDDCVLEQYNEYISVVHVISELEDFQRKITHYSDDIGITNEDIKDYVLSHQVPDNDKNSYKSVIRFLNRHKFNEMIIGYYFDDSTGLYENINKEKTDSLDNLYTFEDMQELLKIDPNKSIDYGSNYEIINTFILRNAHTFIKKSDLANFQPFIDAQVAGLFDDNIPYFSQDDVMRINHKKNRISYEEYTQLLNLNRDLSQQVALLQLHLTFSDIPYETDEFETNDEDCAISLSLTDEITDLKNTIEIKNNEIKDLGVALKATEVLISKLKVSMQRKDIQIDKLKNDIQKENGDVFLLNMDLGHATKQIDQLKSKIQEFEALQISEQPTSRDDESNLLSLIFDESAAERYAPDLVSAIKLWEHIYIINPKDDSHSGKADTWLKKNTGYDIAKKAGSASKIREVTAPFLKWSTHRDKAHKK